MPEDDGADGPYSHLYPEADYDDSGGVTEAEARRYGRENAPEPRGGPGLLDKLRPLAPYVDAITDFFENPAKRIRKVVSGMLLAGIAWFVDPLFDAVLLVFLGTQPTAFAGPNEQYGLADLPVALASILGDLLSLPVGLLFEIPVSVVGDLTASVPGPFDAVIATVAFASMGIVVARYGPLVARAALEAVPFIGGPLSTLLGGSR